MGDTGFEPVAETTCKTALLSESGAESGAVGARTGADSPLIDADLQAIINAWSGLSAGVKQRILLAIRDGE